MFLEGVERFNFFFFLHDEHMWSTEVSLGNGVKKISHFLGCIKKFHPALANILDKRKQRNNYVFENFIFQYSGHLCQGKLTTWI